MGKDKKNTPVQPAAKNYAEMSNEDLVATCVEFEKSLEEANKHVSRQGDLLKDSEALIKEGKDLIAGLKQTNEEQEKLIGELNEKISEQASDNKIAGVKFIITQSKTKKKYEVRMPKFEHNGKMINRDQLKANPALVDELLEIGSGVLKEIVS